MSIQLELKKASLALNKIMRQTEANQAAITATTKRLSDQQQKHFDLGNAKNKAERALYEVIARMSK